MGVCSSYLCSSSTPSSTQNLAPSNNNHSSGTDFSSATATTTGSANRSQLSEAVSENSVGISPLGQNLETSNLKVFTLSDLITATKNFRQDTFLGQGGFGKVYRGWVDEKTLSPCKPGSGIIVAVKRLNSESVQGFSEWRSEIHFLGKLSHPNLVKLIGYCWEDKELLLVYEFLPRGSLENHLFRRNNGIESLSWDLRLKIAIGAARGLAFLHTSDREVIYRDFKASNILLDSDYNAKISDFGLAKLGPTDEKSHVTTRIMGTYGYAAPEYMATGHLYVKSDVYGFGVVLLEMMTGQRAHDTRRPDGQQSLVDWLRPCLKSKSKVKAIMDTGIKDQYSSKAIFEIANITFLCLEPDPRKRPDMKHVLDVLENVRTINVSKRTVPKASSSNPPPQTYQYRYQAGGGRPRSSSPVRERVLPRI